MKIKLFQAQMKNYKRNHFISMEWQTIKGNYTKVSKGVVRLLNPTIQTNKNGVEYVRINPTKNHKLPVKSRYFCNGVEITKSEYDSAIPQGKPIEDWFSKHICDIIRIG